MKSVLVDAGPLVALLHRDDHAHADCCKVFRTLRKGLLTTWPVVTECMYLLQFSWEAQSALLELIERGALTIAVLSSNDLGGIRALMRKYQDTPMDFADATLVHVAAREGLPDIFTLDRRDFSVYRLKGGRTFNIVPLA